MSGAYRIRYYITRHPNAVYTLTRIMPRISAHRIPPVITAAPGQPSVVKYVVPIVCIVAGALLTMVGLYTYKHVLYKRRYRTYMRTHYETDSEAVSVSNENYDLGEYSRTSL